LLVGCGPPPQPPEPPSGSPPSTATVSPGPTVPPTAPTGAPVSPSPGFGEQTAVNCAGEPAEDEVLALLRDEGVLGGGADAEVVEGPLCSGTWQYTVVSVPDLDPLQVVTRGEPDALELVTAGTDVCSVEVRIQAPPGIRGAAACVG
jgi:hypothetical protein